MKAKSLQDLQGIQQSLAQARARKQAQEAARIEAERQAQAEKNLFARAAGQVQPLTVPPRVTLARELPPPLPVQLKLDEQRVLQEALSDEFDTSTLLGFDSVTVTGAVGGTGTTGGRGATSEAEIQLPELQVQSIRTTVSVPDKGTILLGGQRRFEEVEIESGVPVLSKIPIVNRFFTNRIDSEQELTLVMLMRPEIVIQSENEELLFPGLVDQLNNIGG